MELSIAFKERCRNNLLHQLHSKVEELKSVKQRLLDDKSGETKSVVGDKYETARSMIQMEEDQINRQLQILNSNILKVKQLRLDEIKIVQHDSLVRLNTGLYYLSIAANPLIIDDQKVFCMSSDAPLSRSILNKNIGDEVRFNGRTFKVLNCI